MSAWTNLLAASSLAIGTAWDLITHPKTGGIGLTTGSVVLDSTNTYVLQAPTEDYHVIKETPSTTSILMNSNSVTILLESKPSSIISEYPNVTSIIQDTNIGHTI